MTKITSFREIPQMTRYPNYRVNVSWDHLESWLKQDSERGPNLDPDFQRAHVWTEDKQVRYVEFILRGGQSAKDLYFNHPGWMSSFEGDFVLVDGKQRLEAVRKFLRNELRVFGSTYDEFTDKMRLTGAEFVVHINDLKTRKEVLQWYLDMNSGGVVHTDDELQKVRDMLERE